MKRFPGVHFYSTCIFLWCSGVIYTVPSVLYFTCIIQIKFITTDAPTPQFPHKK